MPDKTVRPFSEFLLAQRRGALHEQLSDSMNELVSAVVEFEKVGTLTLKIKCAPAGKGYSPTVVLTDAITMKVPEGAPEAALFFVDDDGNLTRRDPNQPELGLRDVATPDQHDTHDESETA